MNNIAYIALGSNIGERYTYLTEAIQFLNKNQHIQVDDVSSVYETDPVGYTDQNCFLNLVIKISTNLSPQELLKVTQMVENDLGRKREIRWGPRTIDLDILLYNQENIEAENLIVPHPRMFERAFVIVPLLEINQDIKLKHFTFTSRRNEKEGVTCMEAEKWGRRIRAFRKLKGYTQEGFAKELGVSVSVLGEVERGNRSPSQDFVVEVAKTLNVSIDELMPK